jgi:hypothetical protein
MKFRSELQIVKIIARFLIIISLGTSSNRNFKKLSILKINALQILFFIRKVGRGVFMRKRKRKVTRWILEYKLIHFRAQQKQKRHLH